MAIYCDYLDGMNQSKTQIQKFETAKYHKQNVNSCIDCWIKTRISIFDSFFGSKCYSINTMNPLLYIILSWVKFYHSTTWVQ